MPDSQAAFALPARFADWFASRKWSARPHQIEMIEAARAGEDALLIAPTGGGKTLGGFLPSLIELADIVSERPGKQRPHRLQRDRRARSRVAPARARVRRVHVHAHDDHALVVP